MQRYKLQIRLNIYFIYLLRKFEINHHASLPLNSFNLNK